MKNTLLVCCQAIFGAGLIAAAAAMWHFWEADGTLMTLMGVAGLFIIEAAFKIFD